MVAYFETTKLISNVSSCILVHNKDKICETKSADVLTTTLDCSRNWHEPS